MAKTFVFNIHGMKCISCKSRLEHTLLDDPQLQPIKLNIDVTTPDPKQATITIDDSNSLDYEALQDRIKNHILSLGFRIDNTPQDSKYHWIMGSLGTVAGLAIMITGLALGGLPLVAMIPLSILSILFTLVLGAQSYRDTWNSLIKAKTLTMDSLFTISTLTVIVVSILGFFLTGLPMMFEAGLLIYGFRHIGLAIEDSIKHKVSPTQFQDRIPEDLEVEVDGVIQLKPKGKVQVGDIILIKPGQIIPLDGICKQDCHLFTPIKNGKSNPEHYKERDAVLAGMVMASSQQPLRLEVTQTLKNSHLARLDKSIAISLNEKAPLQSQADKILTYFIPAIMGIAVLSGLLLSFLVGPAIGIQCAIAVLVSACPCTIGLVIPLAMKTGIHKAAEHGILFKSPKGLQDAEQIDCVIFDLNGTLTEGSPFITEFKPYLNTSLSPIEILNICAGLEQEQTHPIGKAIYEYCKEKHAISCPLALEIQKYHSGIVGTYRDTRYALGDADLMRRSGIEFSSISCKPGDRVLYLAENNVVIAHVICTDPLRNDAIPTIQALKKMGKSVYLCTGSDEATALRYAQELGIASEQVAANCPALPDGSDSRSKVSYIRELQSKGHQVALFGDSGNDAPGMAASNFGVAVYSKNWDEQTRLHSGAILQNNNLLAIPSAFIIAQQSVANIKQNLIMSLTYNLLSIAVSAGLLVGLGIVMNPAIGVALMVIQACLILANVYRFKQQSVEFPLEESSTKLSSNGSTQCIVTQLAYPPKNQLDLNIEAVPRPETVLNTQPDVQSDPVLTSEDNQMKPSPRGL